MPEAHRAAGEWSPRRLIRWAAENGPCTGKLIRRVLDSRKHPQGLPRLGHPEAVGGDRLEAACRRALALGSCRYQSIESILRHRLDEQPLTEQPELALPDAHANIRGPDYYH